MTEADVGSEECRGGGGGGARGGVLSWALLEEKDECQLVTAQEQSTVPYHRLADGREEDEKVESVMPQVGGEYYAAAGPDPASGRDATPHVAAIRFASPFPPPPQLPTYYVRALFSSTQATIAATDADAAGAALAVYVRMSIRWRSGWLQVIGAGKIPCVLCIMGRFDLAAAATQTGTSSSCTNSPYTKSAAAPTHRRTHTHARTHATSHAPHAALRPAS
ncbi:hypothetical protein PCL_08015 [Purpureocillium lilacinum]|uniref:Uncharacterized protein n=1 Tax=Purpureocillium lilacinum TaxID=33203 RepID=A0A2U3EJN3_PURLI|nr:hypothetical protein PCL_08015 [Purpureocillium lilacinum]